MTGSCRRLCLAVLTLGIVGLAFYVAREPMPPLPEVPADLLQVERSPEWRRVRLTHLKQFPRCEIRGCMSVGSPEVHHVLPFHERPELELEPTNLITLCRWHHFSLGHSCGTGKSHWANCENEQIRTVASSWTRSKEIALRKQYQKPLPVTQF